MIKPDNPRAEPDPSATKLPEILVVTAPATVAVPDMLTIFPLTLVRTATHWPVVPTVQIVQ